MPPHSLRLRSSAGFTLVELLVVISIIAVLVAILLPAISQARFVAKNVICQSQQRQYGLAFRMYGDDFDDWLPAPTAWGSTGGIAVINQNWGDVAFHGKLYDYLESAQVYYDPDFTAPTAGGWDSYTYLGEPRAGRDRFLDSLPTFKTTYSNYTMGGRRGYIPGTGAMDGRWHPNGGGILHPSTVNHANYPGALFEENMPPNAYRWHFILACHHDWNFTKQGAHQGRMVNALFADLVVTNLEYDFAANNATTNNSYALIHETRQ